MKRITLFAGVLSILLVFQSCSFDSEFNGYFDIPDYVWKSTKSITFDVKIDAPKNRTFDIYYDVRYGVHYPYRNLYITYEIKDTLNNLISQGRQNLLLFEGKTGAPKGDGLGDIFDYEFLSLEDIPLPDGIYTLTINQIMREEELPYIMSLGVKIKEHSEQE